MIDRSRRFSTSTPLAFITTSAIPEVAPYTNRARHRVSRFGARPGSTRESVHPASSIRWAVRAPSTCVIRPASGIASEAPSAGIASARPSCPALTEAWSATQGTREANDPATAPCTANTVATA